MYLPQQQRKPHHWLAMTQYKGYRLEYLRSDTCKYYVVMETRMYEYRPKGEGEGVLQKTVIDGMGLKTKILQNPKGFQQKSSPK